MERNIIVIDDFYDDPDEVRNFGLTAEYPDPGENYTYPGKNSRLGFYNDDTHKKMESIVGAGLEPSDPCGYFRISLEHDSLKQDYEVKRLMALDKGESIRQEIEQMEKQIQNFQAEKIGPQGELMRKQAQLEYEILGKVKKAVDKVAIDGGFDYIIDASVGLLYFKPKYDMTDDVLHELRNLTTGK